MDIKNSPIIIFLVAIIVLVIAGGSFFINQENGPTIAPTIAQQLFVPIYCTGPRYYHTPIGTGFPVAPHVIMTANHVQCEHDEKTEISLTYDKTWENIPPGFIYQPIPWEDVQVMYTSQTAGTIAKFETTSFLGEQVNSLGVPDGFMLMTGFVMQHNIEYIYTTLLPIGGLSGAAIVNSHGKVLGMTTLALPALVGEGVSGAYTSAVSAFQLKTVLEKAKKDLPSWF